MSEKPRVSGLRSEREAFLRADYDTCAGLLSARRGIERDLLLARTYIRMNRLDDAERVLGASRGQGRSMWASLKAQLLIRRGETAAAGQFLDRALEAAPSDQERCEAQYLRALLEWTAMRRDNAQHILDTEQFGSFAGNAESLRGWLSIAKGDYASALNSLESAVKLFGSDIFLECNALRTASNLAREMYMPAVMARVLHRVQRIQWTPYLQVPRFYIMRSAAWFRAIDGEYGEAMRQFHELAALNIADPWRLYTYCDRAYFSFVLGEDINGWATAEEALALADRIDWESCTGGEIVALLYVVNLFAIRRPLDAQRYWKLYKALTPKDPQTRAAMSAEPSVEAWEEYTGGLLEKGAGNATTAAAHFNRAYSIYRRIGFEWRAVLTLLAQRDIAPDDRTYEEYIETVLRRFPNSWLRRLADHERRRRGPHSVTSIA